MGLLAKLALELREKIHAIVLSQEAADGMRQRIYLRTDRQVRIRDRNLPGLLSASTSIQGECLPLWRSYVILDFRLMRQSGEVEFVLNCLEAFIHAVTRANLARLLHNVAITGLSSNTGLGRHNKALTHGEVLAAAKVTEICHQHGFSIPKHEKYDSDGWRERYIVMTLLLPAGYIGYKAHKRGWTDAHLQDQINTMFSEGDFHSLHRTTNTRGSTNFGIARVASTSCDVHVVCNVKWRQESWAGKCRIVIVDGERWIRLSRRFYFGNLDDDTLDQCRPKVCADADCWYHWYGETLYDSVVGCESCRPIFDAGIEESSIGQQDLRHAIGLSLPYACFCSVFTGVFVDWLLQVLRTARS
ncbi:uncharacterized protein K489DRAFT_121650 [Dissoconium aciculare CBS 342.82]|uniref:Uncharacterized protein n=1 Tax=Dissoconium aciculare CBS 342.82 TaxID=1314786 RepID=A0A6J3MF80_9PEZI|nr:uncharacterized protein K489DRAFT_121650 [Dissoconium aciculare CBS 342.82]KAF1826630.1 hypothetical protein K489DRAFT_121650 [Dissoconium aciculare CBS 342.82]